MSKQEKDAKTVEAEVVNEEEPTVTKEDLKEMQEQLEAMRRKLPAPTFGSRAKDFAYDAGVTAAAIGILYGAICGIRALRGTGSSGDQQGAEDNVSYLNENVA